MDKILVCVLIALATLAAYTLGTRSCCLASEGEGFTVRPFNDNMDYKNKGEEPWNHHVVHDSLLPVLETNIKYKNAYYYELDNDAFVQALFECFQVVGQGKQDVMQAVIKKDPWTPVTLDADALASYNAVRDTITDTLKSNTSCFKLPDGSSLPLQVVHDRLQSASISISKEDGKNVTVVKYLFKLEMILYRESKYQGKHIGCVCINDVTNRKIVFVQMKILGVVSADEIGLFPVLGNDPMTTSITFGTFTPTTF